MIGSSSLDQVARGVSFTSISYENRPYGDLIQDAAKSDAVLKH